MARDAQARSSQLQGSTGGGAADPPLGSHPVGGASAGPATDLVRVGEVELCVELVGDLDGPVLVLVNGLGGQLVDWDDRFLGRLRALGFTTVRFDNRDAGLSSGADDRFGFDRRVFEDGPPPEVAYGLEDLADDVVGLLDALGVARAHLLGVSMGGMIVQLVAVRHPDRVLSLCSVMSTTGAPNVGRPTAEAAAVLATPAPADPEAQLAWELDNHRVIGSPGFPADPNWLAARAQRRISRAVRPAGTARQLMAILVAGDRTEALRQLAVPTLVVHGAEDPLVDVSGGRATAAAVPGAELVVVPGMGHDLPVVVGEWLAERLAAHAATVDRRIRPVPVQPPPRPSVPASEWPRQATATTPGRRGAHEHEPGGREPAPRPTGGDGT
jgi:pimeloyl-ACP methyl ester carboxylesterase